MKIKTTHFVAVILLSGMVGIFFLAHSPAAVLPRAGATGECQVSDNGCPRSLGVYPGFTFPADIDSYTALAGKKPAVVEWFQSWSEPLYYGSQKTGIDSENVTPLITWSPASTQTGILASINSGAQDTYIRQQADLAKAWNRPIMIRLMHEMNGNWQSFGLNVNGNTSQNFIDAWRHVVTIFRQEGATNVSWVWSPNLISSNSPDPTPLYPGDSYVDWTALDGYNPGTAIAPWKTMGTLFGPSYDIVTSLSNKPFMIAEWGSAEDGGDKGAWITQSFFTDIPSRLPKTRLVVSFGIAKEHDWRINSSAGALTAYQQVAASAAFDGSLSATPQLRGDVTGADGNPDGQINIYDMSYIIRHYDTTDTAGDISGPAGSPDGTVNIYDISYIIRNYQN